MNFEGHTDIQYVAHVKSLDGNSINKFYFCSPQFGMCSEQEFQGRKGKEHSREREKPWKDRKLGTTSVVCFSKKLCRVLGS